VADGIYSDILTNEVGLDLFVIDEAEHLFLSCMKIFEDET
jgi:hypothetical protein